MSQPNAHRRRSRRRRPLVAALYVNAALLAGAIVTLLGTRGGHSTASPFDSVAFGQLATPPLAQPIAGGAGFYLMPAQFDATHWGCYVMDVDAQTLVAYQYNPRIGATPPSLQLVAARGFRYDRQLQNYNTTPKPDDVRQIVELEKQGITGGLTPNSPDGSTATPNGDTTTPEPTSRPIAP